MTAGSNVAPALIERFRADLRHLAVAASSPDRPLGIAVSGGGDSLALLLLARAACPGAVAAATVDHGLRPEAAAEARQVAGICAELGVPHAILHGAPLDPAAYPTCRIGRGSPATALWKAGPSSARWSMWRRRTTATTSPKAS